MSENQGVAGLGPLPTHDAANRTEELREEIEQTRAQLSETIDASQEPPSPEHLGEQAQETVQGTTKHRVGQAREMIRKAAAGILVVGVESDELSRLQGCPVSRQSSRSDRADDMP